jgi:hypothetical protein
LLWIELFVLCGEVYQLSAVCGSICDVSVCRWMRRV